MSVGTTGQSSNGPLYQLLRLIQTIYVAAPSKPAAAAGCGNKVADKDTPSSATAPDASGKAGTAASTSPAATSTVQVSPVTSRCTIVLLNALIQLMTKLNEDHPDYM